MRIVDSEKQLQAKLENIEHVRSTEKKHFSASTFSVCEDVNSKNLAVANTIRGTNNVQDAAQGCSKGASFLKSRSRESGA